jgi:hypothetical protein
MKIKLVGGPYEGTTYDMPRFPGIIIIPVRSQLSDKSWGRIEHFYELKDLDGSQYYEFIKSIESAKSSKSTR